MTDAAHICALKCIVVPIQYLSNALSLGFLFYYLQSPQPFQASPWSTCVSLSLPICRHVCLSCHLLVFPVSLKEKGGAALVPLSHLSIYHYLTLILFRYRVV